MKAVLSHKCPNCSGEVRFDITKKRMTCPHCSSDFSVYSFHTNPAEWSGADEEDIGLFTCENCGGDVTAPKKDTTATCPYCDSRLTLAGRLSGKKRPDYILPFEISHDDAVKIFKQHLKEKVLLPDAFKSEAHLLKCRRVYLPFFMFSADIQAEYDLLQANNDSYLRVPGKGSFSFKLLPVDACKGISNSITKALEPFDFKKAMPFSPSYLTDCNAEVYDDSADSCIKIATKRMVNVIHSQLKQYYNYDQTWSTFDGLTYLSLTDIDVKYVFFPVWILSTRYKKKNYIFALNGQTGKIVSRLPVDTNKLLKKFVIRGLPIFGVGALLSAVLCIKAFPKALLIPCIILSLITALYFSFSHVTKLKKELDTVTDGIDDERYFDRDKSRCKYVPKYEEREFWE